MESFSLVEYKTAYQLGRAIGTIEVLLACLADHQDKEKSKFIASAIRNANEFLKEAATHDR